jgi:chromate transporter
MTADPRAWRHVLPLVLRASATHIGGTATQAWLREKLVHTGRLSADDFNRCFAVARFTPGTNLLAFHAGLGHRLGRWRGAIAFLTVSTVVPASIATTLALVYVGVASVAGVGLFIAGAQAAAVAVLVWTSLQLLTATAAERPARSAALAAGATALAWWGAASPVVVLLAAATAGALWLRDPP